MNRVARLLSFSERKLIVLADGAAEAHLRPLYLRLVQSGFAPNITFRAEELKDAPLGSVVVLVVRPGDIAWLNANRPLFAERALRVVLTSRAETTLELRRHAPDFFDWISHVVPVPPRPFGFAERALRRAERAPTGVSWLGGDLEGTLAAIAPEGYTTIVGSREYGEVLDALRAAPRGWVVFDDVVSFADELRVACALHEARRWRRWIVRRTREDGALPLTLPTHAEPLGLVDAAARLARAGHPAPCALAVLLDLEPSLVETAARGAPLHQDRRTMLSNGEDPARALGASATFLPPREVRSELRRLLEARSANPDADDVWGGVDVVEERLGDWVGAPSRAPLLFLRHSIAVASRSNDGTIWRSPATLAAMCGALDVAEELLQRALAAAPDSMALRLQLVELLEARGEVTRAWTVLEECANAPAPHQSEVLRMRALLHRSSGSLALARAEIQEATALMGDLGTEVRSARLARDWSALDAALGDDDEAIVRVEEVATSLLEKLGSRHPETLVALTVRGEVRYRRVASQCVGVAECLADLETARSAWTERFGDHARALAWIDAWVADVLAAQGRRQEATARARHSELVLGRDPSKWRWMAWPARLSFHLRSRRGGDRAQLTAHLERAVQVARTSVGLASGHYLELIVQGAREHERAGDRASAIRVIEEGLQELRNVRSLRPDRAPLYAFAALAASGARMLLRGGEPGRAHDLLREHAGPWLRELERARNTTSPPALRSIDGFGAARPELSAQDFEVPTPARTDGAILFVLATSAAANGDLLEAAGFARWAAERAPAYLPSLALLVLLDVRQQRDTGASAALAAAADRQTLELGPLAYEGDPASVALRDVERLLGSYFG